MWETGAFCFHRQPVLETQGPEHKVKQVASQLSHIVVAP